MRQVGISRATYYRYKHKLDRGENLVPKSLERGPRKFTASVRRSMGQLVAQDPERSSIELSMKLEERFGITFSSSGFRKSLQSMGHTMHVAEPRRLTPENKQERLNYARRNLNTDWNRLWAYDEVYFNLWKSRHWPPGSIKQSHRASSSVSKVHQYSRICLLRLCSSDFAQQDVRFGTFAQELEGCRVATSLGNTAVAKHRLGSKQAWLQSIHLGQRRTPSQW